MEASDTFPDMKYKLLICLFVTFLAPVFSWSEMSPLFNGTDFSGWHIRPGGTWTLEDQVIIGKTEKSEKRHGMLVSDKEYTDFRARFEFLCAQGDSGFYFRVQEVAQAVSVKGFQVEVDASLETGGLYETGGRAWVSKPNVEQMKKCYTPGTWTVVEVSAIGSDIEVKVNGELVTKIHDEVSARKGHLGLQLHGGMDMEVRYRNVTLEEVSAKP